MLRRILFTTAAVTTLAASPAFAADRADAKDTQPCSCCSDGSTHHADHAIRERNANRSPSRAAQPAQSDDPFVRNQSFGG